MMPISIFLQCLDSRVWDVVLLRKGADQATYFAGVEGVAASLPTLVQYVESAVPAKAYRRIVTYGTSGGGLAAILAAMLMGAARGISISGAPPQATLDPWLEWQLALRRTYAARRPELDYVLWRGLRNRPQLRFIAATYVRRAAASGRRHRRSLRLETDAHVRAVPCFFE
jgi:hypothetical protein